MNIKYDDIIDQREKLRSALEKRHKALISDAAGFLKMLTISLDVPSYTPKDPSGKRLEWVNTFAGNDELVYPSEQIVCPPHSMGLEPDFSIKFYIGLLVDENYEDGYYVLLPVKMRYENGLLLINYGEVEFSVPHDVGNDRFRQVAKLYKGYFMEAMTDHRLN